MAFTAYMFQEDCNRLTTHEYSHASAIQKGGSLFGQWTSTGNPVVHHVMSYSSSQHARDEMETTLFDRFRVCYIGEWRPVQRHIVENDQMEMKARGYLMGRERSPARFLVLDVSRANIVPFLLQRQGSHVQQGMGNLEKLRGENPFNKMENFSDQPYQPRNYNNPPRFPESSATGGNPWPPVPAQPAVSPYQQANYHNPPRFADSFAAGGQHRPPAPQPAVTERSQWYSRDDGNEKLQKVFKGLEEIALRGDVKMSRDTRTQDITMLFTEKRTRREWEVKFPSKFPKHGAILIERPGTSLSKEHIQPDRPQGSVTTALKGIVDFIKNKTGIFS